MKRGSLRDTSTERPVASAESSSRSPTRRDTGCEAMVSAGMGEEGCSRPRPAWASAVEVSWRGCSRMRLLPRCTGGYPILHALLPGGRCGSGAPRVERRASTRGNGAWKGSRGLPRGLSPSVSLRRWRWPSRCNLMPASRGTPPRQEPGHHASDPASRELRGCSLHVRGPADGPRHAHAFARWAQLVHPVWLVSGALDGGHRCVLSQSNLFTFFFSQRRAAVTMRSSMIQMTEALPAGQFHQLAVIYTVQQGSANGILQFFVDGALVSQTALTGSASSTTQSLFVGNATYPVAVRRLWLTSTAVTPEQLVDTRFGTTGTAPFAVQSTWDWGQVPAAIIGAPTPVALGGAAPSLTTPVLPGEAGVASLALSTAETLTRVTLQGWFWFPPSVNQSQVGKQQTLALVTGASGSIDLHATPNSDGTWDSAPRCPATASARAPSAQRLAQHRRDVGERQRCLHLPGWRPARAQRAEHGVLGDGLHAAGGERLGQHLGPGLQRGGAEPGALGRRAPGRRRPSVHDALVPHDGHRSAGRLRLHPGPAHRRRLG